MPENFNEEIFYNNNTGNFGYNNTWNVSTSSFSEDGSYSGEYIKNYTEYIELGKQTNDKKGNRPNFDVLKQNYNTNDEGADFYRVLGGEVVENLPIIPNSCALRLSNAFNNVGICIPKGNTWKDRNGMNNYPKLNDIVRFINDRFDGPDKEGNRVEQFLDHKGIMLFRFSDNSATGHITLWDGSNCLYLSDFDKPDVKVYLWILPSK